MVMVRTPDGYITVPYFEWLNRLEEMRGRQALWFWAVDG
jgi:hypothetical protein